MTDLLRQRPQATQAMLDNWSDRAWLSHATRFEGALAQAQAREGVIAQAAADAIIAACQSLRPDPAELAERAALAGTLAIPLVEMLRAEVPEQYRACVHRGATSQDVIDTATMIQVRGAATLLRADTQRMLGGLAVSARKHAATPAMGRTLLQDAVPIALGLRIAQWHAGIADAWAAFARDVRVHAVLQFGGAVGTRMGQDGKGHAVAVHLSKALDLPVSPPWHARRGGVAAIGTSLAILVGTVGKMARDMSLLSQNAIGEMREPEIEGRGGSSAMSHKRNATGSQVALSAALRAPGLAATLLSGLPAEQERGIGGWQAEAPVLADLFLLASGALSAMADVAEGLEIDVAQLAGAVPGDAADCGESAELIEELLSIERDR